LIGHWLPTALRVEDDQAAVRERSVGGKPLALGIRPPITQRLRHLGYDWPLMRQIMFPINPASDTTHSFVPFLSLIRMLSAAFTLIDFFLMRTLHAGLIPLVMSQEREANVPVLE
jgi:hypothetical protein